MRARGETAAGGRRPSGLYLALLVAIGIGLHNLGEGLAIGAAYAAGALALGALLVIGFAIHNTTEGLAVVAPVAEEPPVAAALAGLGLIAGGPAIVGAWIGASAFNGSVVAFLLGVGAGAIAQVIVQLAPFIRDEAGRHLYPQERGRPRRRHRRPLPHEPARHGLTGLGGAGAREHVGELRHADVAAAADQRHAPAARAARAAAAHRPATRRPPPRRGCASSRSCATIAARISSSETRTKSSRCSRMICCGSSNGTRVARPSANVSMRSSTGRPSFHVR